MYWLKVGECGDSQMRFYNHASSYMMILKTQPFLGIQIIKRKKGVYFLGKWASESKWFTSHRLVSIVAPVIWKVNTLISSIPMSYCRANWINKRLQNTQSLVHHVLFYDPTNHKPNHFLKLIWNSSTTSSIPSIVNKTYS